MGASVTSVLHRSLFPTGMSRWINKEERATEKEVGSEATYTCSESYSYLLQNDNNSTHRITRQSNMENIDKILNEMLGEGVQQVFLVSNCDFFHLPS